MRAVYFCLFIGLMHNVLLTILPLITAKRSCGKVMFYTCLWVILLMGGGGSPWQRDPLDRDPSWTEIPLERDLPGQRPPGQRPPWTETPRMVKSRRYTSYWDAFLFYIFLIRCNSWWKSHFIWTQIHQMQCKKYSIQRIGKPYHVEFAFYFCQFRNPGVS